MRSKWAQLGVSARQRECAHHARRTLFIQYAADGSEQVYEGCADCGFNTSGKFANQHRDIDTARLPVGADRRYQNPPCAVCGAFGTQLHHWAPRELFGPECEHWPTSYLCPGCHNDWHTRIKHARGAA